MALRLGRFTIEKFRLDSLYSVYLGMNPREQTFAMAAAAVVVILVLVLPVTVASSRIASLEREADKGRTQLREVMRALEDYDQNAAKLKQMRVSIGGGFDSSISTTLETLAEQNGLKDRIDSLKERAAAPSEVFDEASVDVRLRKVTLNELINYLHAIENNPSTTLNLKSLSVKTRFDNKQELDVSFTVSTYRLLEGAAENL